MGQFFAAPQMLWWTTAAAVPILIHLFSRRRYKRVPWAAMEFLARAIKRTRRRLRIENLLLMLLRAAALLFFALAISDPQVSGSGLLGSVGDDGRSILIAIDTSFSMGARDASDRTRFEKARKIAADLLAGLDPQTDAAALLTSGRPAHLESHLSRDIARLRRRVEELEVGDGSTDLVGALEAVRGLLSEPEIASEFPGHRTLYVITDMQKSAFTAGANSPAPGPDGAPAAGTEGADQQIEELLRGIRDAGGETVFVDVAGLDDAANVAVVGLRHSGRALVRGLKSSFECRVRNFGDQPVSGELQFFLDDEAGFVQRERVVDLKGRGTGTEEETERAVSFNLTLPAPGWHHVAVRWVDDSLKVDNTRRFAFQVQDKIRVLAVSGGFAREGEEASTFFVARALDPWLGRSHDQSTAFDVRETTLAQIATERIENVDVVVLADVPQLPPARLEEIDRLVREGGALVFFPGRSFEVSGRTGAEGTIDAQFHKNGLGLLPCSLLGVEGSDASTDKAFNLQFETFDHPATRYFEDPKIRPLIARMPVYRITRLGQPEGDGSPRVLATFVPAEAGQAADGEKARPAIVEKEHGLGRVVQFATSADTSWAIWGATPAFVPLMKETAYYLAQRPTQANRLVGESIVLRLPPTVTEVDVQENDGPVTKRNPSMAADQTGAELQIRRIQKASLYRFSWMEADAGVAPRPASSVATVNVDPVESDLAPFEPGLLAARLGSDIVRVVDDPKELVHDASPAQRTGLSRLLLQLVGGFLLIETLLAWRFGRNMTVETAA